MPSDGGHWNQPPNAAARLAYALAMQALLPLLLARLWWRGRQLPEFRAHWRERLGWYPGPAASPPARQAAPAAGPAAMRPTALAPAVGQPTAAEQPAPARLWVHAVSLGETQASLPLLRALQARWPGCELVLTHMTPTGRAAGAAFGLAGVRQAYLPYDAPGAMARFLRHFRPQLGLLMETEVWPGMVEAAGRAGCPLLLVNARLSERSARGYARFGAFARAVFGGLSATGAQTGADANRLRSLGADPVTVTGNLKFDMAAPAGEDQLAVRFRQWWGTGRPVWLAASTREGEEALVLDALAAIGRRPLLVLVPRHPQRFDEVAELLRARGIVFVRRSQGVPAGSDCQVVLGDSLGELGAYYRSVDLAFVGGSLLPLGGQNLLEACARACPVLIGPHTFNFALAAEQAVAAGAARRVADPVALGRQVTALLADAGQRQEMGQAGLSFVAQHRGAAGRTLALVERVWRARLEGTGQPA